MLCYVKEDEVVDLLVAAKWIHDVERFNVIF